MGVLIVVGGGGEAFSEGGRERVQGIVCLL